MLQVGILAAEGCKGFLIGIDDHILLCHLLAESGKVWKTALVNEQAVEGVADRDATGLGIVDNRLAHAEITLFVEIGIHHTGTRLNHRHPGGIPDEVDELTTATGDAEIHVPHGIEHFACSLMGGGQQGDDIRTDTIFFQDLMDQCHLLTVGAVGILAAFQHTGVTALETEGKDIECHVGTGLVDHADDTEGHRDTTEAQTVRQCLLLSDVS